MTSSSREKLRTTVCSLVVLLAAPGLLFAQQPADSSYPPPAFAPLFDRYTIDVDALTKNGTARSLSDVLTSQVPGLLVIPGGGLNGGGSQVRFAGVRSLISDLPPLILLDGVRIDAQEDDSRLTAGRDGAVWPRGRGGRHPHPLQSRARRRDPRPGLCRSRHASHSRALAGELWRRRSR